MINLAVVYGSNLELCILFYFILSKAIRYQKNNSGIKSAMNQNKLLLKGKDKLKKIMKAFWKREKVEDEM